MRHRRRDRPGIVRFRIAAPPILGCRNVGSAGFGNDDPGVDGCRSAVIRGCVDPGVAARGTGGADSSGIVCSRTISVPTIVEMDALPDAEVTVPELIVIPRRSSDFVFIQASPVAPLALTIPELFVVALKKAPGRLDPGVARGGADSSGIIRRRIAPQGLSVNVTVNGPGIVGDYSVVTIRDVKAWRRACTRADFRGFVDGAYKLR